MSPVLVAARHFLFSDRPQRESKYPVSLGRLSGAPFASHKARRYTLICSIAPGCWLPAPTYRSRSWRSASTATHASNLATRPAPPAAAERGVRSHASSTSCRDRGRERSRDAPPASGRDHSDRLAPPVVARRRRELYRGVKHLFTGHETLRVISTGVSASAPAPHIQSLDGAGSARTFPAPHPGLLT